MPHKDIEKKRAAGRKTYWKHREKYLETSRQYRLEHKEQRREAHLRYYRENKDKIKLYWRGFIFKLKTEVLTHYGNGNFACVKCGESRPACLSIDHINGDGAKHRKATGRQATDMYRWLKQNDYPKGFQTLCMNCQWIKRFENREFRH